MTAAPHTVALTPYSEPRPGVVLIGANCLRDRADPRYAGLEIVSPYRSHAELARAVEYCWKVSLDASAALGERLGEFAGARRSTLYWQCLLLPWMTAWVENLYDRYLRLCWVRDNAPAAALELPQTAVPRPLYAKSFEVWGRSHLHLTNIRIYRLLADAMGLAGQVRAIDAPVEDDEHSPAPGAAASFTAMLRRYARFVLRPDPFRQSGLGWSEFADDAMQDSGFARDAVDRDRLRIPGGDEFQRILGELMPYAVPLSLAEEQRSRSEFVGRQMSEKDFPMLCISTAFWMNDSLKYLLAAVKTGGGRIIGRQHGGGYGCFELTGPETVERFVSDAFVSWGWSDGRGCPTLPLPDPRLSEVAESHRAKNGDILFIGTHGPMYVFRYQSYWLPEYVHASYLPMQERFFRGLSDVTRRRLVYRPYPKEYGWREQERVSAAVPGMRFDVSKGALESLQQCSLVVLDHAGTTILEALAISTPIIAYWDMAQCVMRKEAQPYFERLVEVGILQPTPEAAAAKVESIASDPQRWWSRPEVQAARKAFARRFAHTDAEWRTRWREALENQVAPA